MANGPIPSRGKAETDDATPDDVGPEWSRRPLVQLRHTGSGFWLLLWQDRRGRWQRYPPAPRPTRDLDALLAEIDEDGISLFST